MIINLVPQYRDDALNIEVRGDVVSINGEEFDFGSVSEGSTIDALIDIPNEFLVGEAGRKDGEIYISVIMPVGPNPSQAVGFPEPIHVTKDGAVDLPKDPEPELPVMPALPDEEPANVDA